MSKLLLTLVVVAFSLFSRAQEIPNPAHPTPCPPPSQGGIFYSWGLGIDGYGYCFAFYPNGAYANGAVSVPNDWCEVSSPSRFQWVATWQGTFCYQYTPSGLVMNQGRAVPPQFCHQH